MNDLPVKPLSEQAQKVLLTCPWRGNVRELENTVHRAVLLSTGSEIDADAITPPSAAVPAEDDAADSTAADAMVGRTVADVEKDLIIGTLKHTLGNRTHAANILGISIRTLRNKLKQYM